jgi:tetratricopeptide (TPR) repeat protein
MIPLALLLLNALRMRNCDLAGGLGWFAILPMSSAVTGAAAGVVSAVVIPRRALATAAAIAIVIASLAWSVSRYYTAPPIFGYDPFGGYFPGSIYDENVAIGAPLLWARAMHFLAALAAILLAAAFLDGTRLRIRLRSLRPRALVCAIAPLAGALYLFHAGPRIGFRLDGDDIARALGATRESEHFRLHYSPTGPWAREIDLFVADHEFRWQQHFHRLGVAPDGKIDSYLFDSPGHKQALTGAGHTSIAKPWRREIYLQHDGWPHPVVAHELAHVFAGRFGDPLFGVARRGLDFDVGLIEGIAVALAWPSGDQPTPDQEVLAMRRFGLEPPLERVMSIGFLGLNAAQAYNVAGSFCHFLVEEFGAAKLGELFHAAGAPESWQRIYGESFAELRARWSQHVDGVALSAEEAERMRDRLQRPSIFHRPCVHELALEREAAHRAAQAGDRVRALHQFEAVCAQDPDDPGALVEVMEAAEGAGRPSDAAIAAGHLRAHRKATGAQKGRAEVELADLAFRRGELDEARAHYQAAARLPLDEPTQRLTTAKLLALDEPPGPIADRLRRFVVAPPTDRDPALDLLTLGELVHADPDRALFHYLLGRQLESRGKLEEATAALSASLSAKKPLPDERFRREALRLLGRAQFRAGKFADARKSFEAIGDGDFVARCDFALHGAL